MTIEALTIEYGTNRRGENYMQVKYEGKQYDSMGEWQSSGVLADVHPCDDHFVLTSPFNSKPLMVCEDVDDMINRLKEQYGINPEIIKK